MGADIPKLYLCSDVRHFKPHSRNRIIIMENRNDSIEVKACAAPVRSAFRISVKDAVRAALCNFERSGYTPEELADEIADILDPPRISE